MMNFKKFIERNFKKVIQNDYKYLCSLEIFGDIFEHLLSKNKNYYIFIQIPDYKKNEYTNRFTIYSKKEQIVLIVQFYRESDQ